MACSNCDNDVERLLTCICDKIFQLHQMVEANLVSISLQLNNISTQLTTIINQLTGIDTTLNTILGVLSANIFPELQSINNNLQSGFNQTINLLTQLLACCQSNNPSNAVRQPVIISVNALSNPPNRITNQVGVVPGNLYIWVEVRNVSTEPCLVNGFYLGGGQSRSYRVNSIDKLGTISYDTTLATSVSLGGTAAATIEIEGILW